MEPRRASLRKRPATDGTPVQEDAGSRAKRAASAYLSGKESILRQVAAEFGVQANHVAYYVKKWRGTDMEAFFETREAADNAPCTPTSGSLSSSTGSSECEKWHLMSFHARRKWAIREAVRLVQEEGMSVRAAAEQVTDRFEADASVPSISKSSIASYAADPDRSPQCSGRAAILPPEFESNLVAYILAKRALRFPVFRDEVLAMANRLIAGTQFVNQFKHELIGVGWYYRLLKKFKHTIGTSNARPLEIDRARWATAEHIQEWYDLVADALVDAGIAVRNPAYDSADPKSEAIFIVHPERLLSFDESRLELDMTSGSKANAERIVVDKREDRETRGETLAHKGGFAGTGVGGSTANGCALPALFIFASGSLKLEWLKPQPRSDFVQADGAMRAPMFTCNAKGGVRDDIGVHYLRDVVLPCFPDISAEKPIVILCDGHGSHLTLDLINFCRANHIRIVLRVPHTSHLTQGEDVCNFAVLKSQIRVEKARVLTSNITNRGSYKLEASDFMKVVTPAWDAAFARDVNVRAWQKTGLNPFTRSVFFDLRDREALARRACDDASIDYAPISALGAPGANGGDNDDGEHDDSALITGRISSAQLYAMGPVTSDRAFNVLNERADARSKAEQEKKDRDAARLVKARELDSALAENAAGFDPKSKAELKKLTIPKLQGLLLLRAPGEWTANKKLKSKTDVLNKLTELYPDLPDETLFLTLAAPTVPEQPNDSVGSRFLL